MSVVYGSPVIPEGPGEWFSVQEAATRLRVGERAIRRRISRGYLHQRILEDGRREVFLPLRTPNGKSVDALEGDNPERAIQLVDRVSLAVARQIETLTLELAAGRQHVETLARENGMLTERVSNLQRELDVARKAPEPAPSGASPAAGGSSVDAAGLAAIRRVNQRQAEDLARLAAELNAIKAAEDQPRPTAASPTPPVQAAAVKEGRSSSDPAAPVWTVWWLVIGLLAVAVCVLVLLLLAPR